MKNNITIEEFKRTMSSMTKEEIKEVSLQKRKNGSATSAALLAQRILWEAKGGAFMSSANWQRNHSVAVIF